jgi:acyl-CoA thioester hydrolase
MARVRIDLPETFEFSAELQVYVGSVNAANHLGNDALIGLLNEALMRFMDYKGFPKLVVNRCALMLVDQASIHKAEAFYGDVLRIDVAAGDFHKHGFDVFYRVTNVKTGREIATAKTGMLFFDLDKKRVAEIPDAFKLVFGVGGSDA